MESGGFESVNINELWTKNIYENLKSLEQLERLAREGCENLFEYFQIPQEQKMFMFGDIMYKNMRFMVTEFILLLSDLTPVMKPDKHKQFLEQIMEIDKIKENRKLFVKDIYQATTNSIKVSKATPFLYDTISFLSTFKIELVREIAHLLYIPEETINRKKW
jgi:hypothetical protein